MRTLPVSQAQLDRLTGQLVDALDRLGYAHKRKDGGRQRVAIRRRLVTQSGGILLLEVDTERLPRGVKARQLIHPETVHHLGAVLHHPVKVLNTTGVTYAILLAGLPGKVALPDHVDLAQALPAHPGGAWTFPVGEGPAGPVWERLRGHYLVGGETGSGKTTWLFSTVLALTLTTAPDALSLILIDPKGVDLLALGGLAHAGGRPVACDVEGATQALGDLVAEISRRRELFARKLSRDLDAYNDRAAEHLPRILAVIDEVTDLALLAGLKSDLYKSLIRLASKGRSFGIHLILATQNPKAEVLNTLIRGNLAGRIAFRVTTPAHSRAILGTAGAERLPGRTPGRMLARLGGGLCELQGYEVGGDVIEALAGPGPQGAGALAFLDGETKRMVAYARERLGGRFPQDDIMAAGWPRRTYRRAVNKLKAAGLLYNDPGQNNALCLDLDRLTGLPD